MFKALAQRLKEFDQSLGARLGKDISSPKARRRAWWHFHFFDHGVLRTFWRNFFPVGPGAWRSNQPSPARIRWFASQGIVTILNLRGAHPYSPYLFEEETCREIGMGLINFPMQARALDTPERLLALLDIFDSIEKPFVMHCKSGADRAGLASALYQMHIMGLPVAVAKKQLGVKFIHFKSFKTGILDLMLEAYEEDTRQNPMPIRDWLQTRYDPAALSARFTAGR